MKLSSFAKAYFKIWKDADDKERYFPHEFMYKMLLSGVLKNIMKLTKDSWMYAAAEKNLPIIVPGWEDSTMGNIFALMLSKES
jgi:deoxyhypusine synthase